MENTGLFNAEGKELSIDDVIALLPSNDDIEKTFPIEDNWSNEDKIIAWGKREGAKGMLSLVKNRLGNKL